MKNWSLLVLVVLLSACRSTIASNTPGDVLTTQAPPVTQTLTPTNTTTPTPVATVETPSPTPAITSFEVCSPLEEETFETLPLILINPLEIPSFGQDTGHHGVDFAYFRRGERESIEGIEIYAILSGRTVLTLDDDIPYGYTVLIETPLSDLPQDLQENLLAGYLPVPQDPNYRLFCPEVTPPALTSEFSVYHLYAHMQVRPGFNRGDPIPCGAMLGTVGNTGYSSNPHLHLETRLGPSGAAFETMAHYENTNSLEQMSNYCLWRMSGYYQLFDPYLLFDAAE